MWRNTTQTGSERKNPHVSCSFCAFWRGRCGKAGLLEVDPCAAVLTCVSVTTACELWSLKQKLQRMSLMSARADKWRSTSHKQCYIQRLRLLFASILTFMMTVE